MKDLFSGSADRYAQYRPAYPTDLVKFILSYLPTTHRAWDCGTGNGQLAALLSPYFGEIQATDISDRQLEQAIKLPGIQYSKQPAEHTNFPDQYFDLITVAQAFHWFDFDQFFQETARVLLPHGYLALIGYGLIRCAPAIQHHIDHFYTKIIGKYWDPERRYLDESYQTIPFPLIEIPAPSFQINYIWSLPQFIGYIGTWSAVSHFQQAKGYTPLPELEHRISSLWGIHQCVTFPLFVRFGHMPSLT